MSWGYASYDEDDHLIYTRYSDDGKVDKYRDNGDGGHSHQRWNNKDDYNLGENLIFVEQRAMVMKIRLLEILKNTMAVI